MTNDERPLQLHCAEPFDQAEVWVMVLHRVLTGCSYQCCGGRRRREVTSIAAAPHNTLGTVLISRRRVGTHPVAWKGWGWGWTVLFGGWLMHVCTHEQSPWYTCT